MKNLTLLYVCLTLVAWACAAPQAAAQLQFSGNFFPAIEEQPEASTGLRAVYVLDNTAAATASYTASSATAQVRWYKFSNLGGGYAQEVPSSRAGNISSVALTSEDMGYIVEEDGRRQCFWIVNYANHVCLLGSIAPSPEQDCTMAALTFSGSADRITYYTVNGVGRALSRGLNVEYYTMEFDEERMEYVRRSAVSTLEYISGDIHLPAPLCDTEFLLSGDRFQTAWGQGRTIMSPTLTTRAIEARTWAEQTSRSIDNEQKSNSAGGDTGALGGSAPVEITFSADVTEAAIYQEWQFAADPGFDIIDLRMNQSVVEKTFNEYGTTYVRFVAGDDSGTCDYISPTYTVNVGESKLDCPNAFSPGSSEGSNDEWKVSYKSIIRFDCHIFNRWGVEVAHLTDPSQGWDGRYNGKLVKSGVFFYVIEAEGADGKVYKLSGDINILNARLPKTYSPSGE